MITGLHHVTFLTADLSRARLFYESLLGLQVDATRPSMSFDGIWYHAGRGQQIHLMVLPDVEAGLCRPAHGGRDRHVALCVSDIAVLRKRLDEAGLVYSVSSSGRAALFCRDPDQNALEFIEVR
jgi:catechol 2,3-dioxygenase-like lactoylglutathione lyase family enzyme